MLFPMLFQVEDTITLHPACSCTLHAFITLTKAPACLQVL